MILERFLKLRWLAMVLLACICGALLPGARYASIPDNALTVWFLENDPQLIAYNEFHKHFGNDEVILLQVERKDGVFTPAFLGRLEKLTSELEKLEGVERVVSILSLTDAAQTNEGISFRKLIPEPIPGDDASLLNIKEQMTKSETFRDRVINSDGTRTMLWIQMATLGDIDAKRDRIVSSVRKLSDTILRDARHPMGGIGVIYSGLNTITQRDFTVFLTAGYLIMFIVLWWIFKSFRLLLAAIGVIAIGVIAALGVYGSLGNQINMITVVIPILIIVLGLADAVHFPASFANVLEEYPWESRFEQVKITLKRVFIPCLFTTLTTMAGFLALLSSTMKVMRDLGIYAAIGLGASFFASVIFMTIAFFWLPSSVTMRTHPIVEKFLDSVRRIVVARKRMIALVAMVVAIISAYGASLVKNDTYSLGYLPKDHPVVQDHEEIVAGWGEYNIIDFLVRPTNGKTVDSPEIVNGMEQFVAQVSQRAEFRHGFSLATIYRRLAGSLALEKPAQEKWRKKELVQLDELLAFEEFSWDRKNDRFDDNLLAPFVSEDRKVGRLFLVGKMVSAVELRETLDSVSDIAATIFDGTAEVEPAGYPPLYVKMIEHVTTSQIRSFFIAISVIFLLMLLWLRSVRLALISLPPNVFPALVMFGVMGYLGIHLDIGTATVAAIVIGIAIDDTIHFLHHFRIAENDGMNWSNSLEHVYRRAGRPAVTTTILLAIGFPILMLAQVRTLFYFGLLTTVAAVAALMADLFILPLLLRLWPNRAR